MISSKTETSKYFVEGLGMLMPFMIMSSTMTFVIADHNVDVSADKADIGRKLCEPHDGLRSFDNGGDFTCTNGTVIHWKKVK